MQHSSVPYSGNFREEDFEAINEKYFKEIRKKNNEIIDPSGWRDTFTPVEPFLGNEGKFIHKYNTDFGNQLSHEKSIVKNLLDQWDSTEYHVDNFTLCHSATISSLVVLSVLSKKGIKTIFFETPCYYATLYQAEDLGLNVILIPSYYEQNFSIDIRPEILKQYGPYAIWLTQPRTSLGYNQNTATIAKMISGLSSNDYLVVDEATEQYFPSHLAEFSVSDLNIIKIRSFFKGMGLNGIRISCIIHPEELREDLMGEMEIYQGALDIYSLKFLGKYGKNINKFKLMLEACRNQINHDRQQLMKACMQSNFVSVSDIVNGYIGCLFLHYDKIDLDHEAIRRKLLEFSNKHNMPLILGSSMRFAIHPNMEFIRLNYYNRFEHLHGAIKNLELFFSGIVKKTD